MISVALQRISWDIMTMATNQTIARKTTGGELFLSLNYRYMKDRFSPLAEVLPEPPDIRPDMTFRLAVLAGCLMAGTVMAQSSASLLVNTRLHPSESLSSGQSLQIDLRDFFQFHTPPGPIATLAIRMPVPEGERSLTVGTETVDVMSYKLASGGTYTDIDAVSASDFEWRDRSVQYQMLADKAPVAVANFMTYAADGVYNNTIVHRNETTGKVFRPSGLVPFTVLPIIQAGGFRLYDTTDYLLEWVPTRPPIVFEESQDNTLGTLAMARTSNPDSATSQFFINLADNTSVFGKAYTVFGELLEPDTALGVLAEFSNSPIFDLRAPLPNGQPNAFPSLPFSFLPLYTPDWSNKDSFARFSTISVAAGNPDGVSYTWSFIDPDPDEQGISEEEATSRGSFDIQLEGSILTVNRPDTGLVTIEVTGGGGGQSSSFRIRLIAFEPEGLQAAAIFSDGAIRRGNHLDSAWFGLMQVDAFPDVLHAQHGPQHVHPVSTADHLLIYDRIMGSWIYTTPSAYPYLYDYSMNQWIYYAQGTGNGAPGSRWFFKVVGSDGWFNR